MKIIEKYKLKIKIKKIDDKLSLCDVLFDMYKNQSTGKIPKLPLRHFYELENWVRKHKQEYKELEEKYYNLKKELEKLNKK